MLNRVRSSFRAPVRRLVFTSIGVASIFGINSVFFLVSQNHLGDIASSVENLQALDQSIQVDREAILSALHGGHLSCQVRFPAGCEDYVSALLLLRNRADDYSAALTADFQASSNSIALTRLGLVETEVTQLASKAFGLSFASAKSLGISSAKDYIDKVQEAPGNAKLATFISHSAKISGLSRETFEFLSDFSRAYRSGIPDYAKSQATTNAFYWIIVLSEIVLFSLVGLVSIYNTRAEGLSKDSILSSGQQ